MEEIPPIPVSGPHIISFNDESASIWKIANALALVSLTYVGCQIFAVLKQLYFVLYILSLTSLYVGT